MALVIAMALILLQGIGTASAQFCDGNHNDYYPLVQVDDYASPFLVNDTFGMDLGDGPQYILCNGTTNALCYSSSTNYDCYTGDTRMMMDVNEGNGTDYGNWEATAFGVYPLNGTDCHDDGIYNRPGTSAGNPVVVDGKVGHAIQFDGTGDYFSLGADQQASGAVTIVAWVNVTNDKNNFIAGKFDGNALDGDYFIYYEVSSDEFSSGYNDGGGWAGSCGSGASSISLNTWYHFAWTFDSDAARCYLNGMLIETDAAPTGDLSTSATDFRIGSRSDDANWDMQGEVDEVILFNRTLSGDEIEALFNNTNPDNYSYAGSSISLAAGTYPQFSDVAVDPVSPQEYPVNSLFFNATVTDSGDSINISWIEHNFSGAMANYDMANVSDVWNYTTGNMSAGEFGYRIHANNSGGNANETQWYYFTVNKATALLNLTLNGSAANYSITFLETINITAWTNVSGLSATIHRNSTAISNPTIYDPAYGYYNLTALLDHANYTGTEVTYWATVAKAASGLTLTASPSWTASEDTTVTITCTANSPLTTTLTFDDVTVTNPYIATHAFGIYTAACTVSDTYNYTPSTTSNSLSITSGGFGCTNTDTYAFEQNFTVDTAISNQTVIDFADLIDDYLVRSDLGDVYPVTDNLPGGWINGTLFIANVTNLTTLTLRFGNNIIGYNWNDTDNTTDETALSYSVINQYIRMTFVDERTGAIQLPPNANHTLFIFCTGGISSHNITGEYMTVATFERADEINARVQYSVTEIYSRNYVIRADVETKNIYLVDADQDQVVQLLIALQDATGDFNNALLKSLKYIEGTQRTITENYFDAEDKVIIYLINGDKYTLAVDNGDEERTIGYLYVDSVDLSKTVTIGEILTTNQTLSNVSFGIYNITDTIIFSYIDDSGLTTLAEMWIWNATNTSHLIYYINSTNRSTVEFTYQVPDDNQTYNVHIKVGQSTFGEDSIDFWIPFFEPQFIIPYPFAFMENLAGDIPGGITFRNLVGIVAIVGAAMMFTALTGALGGIIAVIAGALFLYFGWWAADVVILGVALVLAFINKLTENKREA